MNELGEVRVHIDRKTRPVDMACHALSAIWLFGCTGWSAPLLSNRQVGLIGVAAGIAEAVCALAYWDGRTSPRDRARSIIGLVSGALFVLVGALMATR